MAPHKFELIKKGRTHFMAPSRVRIMKCLGMREMPRHYGKEYVMFMDEGDAPPL